MRNALLIAIAIAAAGTCVMLGIDAKNKQADPKGQTQQEEDVLWGDESLGIDPAIDEKLQDYRTIYLFGLDNKSRSDIIMVFVINEKTNSAKVFSVYRDTYMQISDEEIYSYAGNDREFFKCNHAYNRGGKYCSIKELNRHLDLNARECFGMDWAAIETLIDDFGGIDVNVTEGMVPWMNGFYGLRGSDQVKGPGPQTLTGKQAVAYLRCRKDPGSDATTRSARNLRVFTSIFDKAKGMSKDERMDAFENVIDQCETNMSRERLTKMLDTMSSMPLEAMRGWPYEYKILWQNDGSFYYYVPQTLESNVKELHSEIFGQKEYEPSETVRELSKAIEKREKTELK